MTFHFPSSLKVFWASAISWERCHSSRGWPTALAGARPSRHLAHLGAQRPTHPHPLVGGTKLTLPARVQRHGELPAQLPPLDQPGGRGGQLRAPRTADLGPRPGPDRDRDPDPDPQHLSALASARTHRRGAQTDNRSDSPRSAQSRPQPLGPGQRGSRTHRPAMPNLQRSLCPWVPRAGTPCCVRPPAGHGDPPARPRMQNRPPGFGPR